MIRPAALVALLLVLVTACSGEPSSVEVGAPATTTTVAAATTTEPAVTTTEPPPGEDDDEGDDEDEDEDEAPPPSVAPGGDCRATVEGLPPMLVSTGDRIVRVENGQTTSVPIAGVTLAYEAASGVVVAQVDAADRTDIVRLDAQGVTTLDGGPRGATLFDVADVGGWPTVFYGTRPGDDLGAEPGQLLSRAIGATTATTLGVAFAPEYAVLRTSTAGDLVAVSAITDLTEEFRFLHLDGRPAEGIANPTTDAPYAAPPLWVEAVLAPDGSAYAYLEGPDTYGDGDPDVYEGDWQLVVLGIDGTERFRTTLAPQEREVWRIDFDGRFVVASIAEPEADAPDELAVVDTAGDGAPVTLCDLGGTATFTR